MANIKELKTPYQSLNLIKAGAGAGKTYHIQKTLTDWIKQNKVQADRILAVTFTNAAANEMQERIRLALIQSGLHEESKLLQQSTISTIHGFGLNLIERFAFERGASPKPKQLTEAEQGILISRALNDVKCIEPILNQLPYWDYKLSMGKDWVSPSEQLKKDLLVTISSLLNLGEKVNSGNFSVLVEQALESVRITYGKGLSKEKTLNKALSRALNNVTNKYTEEQLGEEWGSNKATRDFVKAIFTSTDVQLEKDWSFWTKLQSIETAPSIFNKKTGEVKHEDGQLAFDIWHVADKLSVHPGPLNKALAKIEMLLHGAKNALATYQEGKNSAGLIDFNDMVTIAEQLMQDESLLSEMKSQYDCLIIDEFQDTNPLQFSLLWAFHKMGIPTLIVGDIKQSIMGFQGADKRLFDSLLKQNPKQTHELTNNWRSTNELMKFINELGSKLFNDSYQALEPQANIKSELESIVTLDFSPSIWSSSKTKNKVGYISEGASATVLEIKSLLKSGKKITDKVTGKKRPIRPSDIAVLGKTHNELGRFASALRYAGIQPQIKEKGWFESDAITQMFYALSYLADPRDQHALLCLKVIGDPKVNLQAVLSEYLNQEKPRKFQFSTVDLLDKVSKSSAYHSLKQLLENTIDALALWDKYSSIHAHTDNEQQRANLLKLIHLVETFDTSESASLRAQGIYGKGLSSFLTWLQVNRDDIDQQPDVDGNNQQAITLTTWFASKGLEWPVVVVLGIEKEVNVRLPHISVQYGEKGNVDEMLESSFSQIVTGFDDATTKQKFVDSLMPFEIDTLKNLTYVVMTRAREQLILPWFDNDKPNNMQHYLRDLGFEGIIRKPATMPKVSPCDNAKSKMVSRIGRITLKPQSLEKEVQAQVSPSLLAASLFDENHSAEIGEITSIDYGTPVDLSMFSNHRADQVGRWIHQCYQVLISNPELLPRLLLQIPAINESSELQEQLISQVNQLQSWCACNWEVNVYKTELPLLAQVSLGVTLNGVLDLLVESEEGYWIVDHKTDTKTSDSQFNHHLPQLLAYAKYLKLKKPILGVAINWVRTGKMTTKRYS